MSTELIGDTTWRRIPGDQETNNDDGSITTTRFYAGAIADGTGGGGEASWEAFRANWPIGSFDPVYGSDVRSVALPSISEARNSTYIASIQFKGGTFDEDGTTAPTTAIKLQPQTIEIKHPSFGGIPVELTYLGWTTTFTFTQKGIPVKTGAKGAEADTTAPILTSPPIKQSLPDEYPTLSDTQIGNSVAVVEEPYLLDMTATRRTQEDGTPIWDVTEVWLMGLEPV